MLFKDIVVQSKYDHTATSKGRLVCTQAEGSSLAARFNGSDLMEQCLDRDDQGRIFLDFQRLNHAKDVPTGIWSSSSCYRSTWAILAALLCSLCKQAQE